MTNLQISSQADLLSYIKENLINGSNLSIRGLARLCGVDDKSLICGADFKSAKLAQKLTAQGFNGADLAQNGFNAKASWLVIEYFAYDSKAQAAGAKQLARTFGTIGIMTTFDKLNEPTEPKKLPPTTMEVLTELNKLDASTLPAHVKQLLLDKVTDEYLTSSKTAQLPALSVRWLGCSQKAEEMGYHINASSRVKLGRFCSKQNLERQKEERMCNSQMRFIWVYKDSQELESAIEQFFM